MVQMFAFGLLMMCSLAMAREEWQKWKVEEETPKYWLDLAKEDLEATLKVQNNMRVAKNVIIMLGDGMGIPTITTGRILKGQLKKNTGEETVLAMDKFPHTGLSKTYDVNRQVADSASTATAYLCGVKSTYYTVGVSGKARFGQCKTQEKNEVPSILIHSAEAGKATGIVTTTRINHGTPAATYAHSASRLWYSDADLTPDAKKNRCKDIAQQFFDNSDKITVALGGGRKFFMPSDKYDPEYPENKDCRPIRKDGQNLIGNWLSSHAKNHLQPKYVWNKEQFDNVDIDTTDRLLGLFEPEEMQFEAFRNKDGAGEPSLTEMAEKAIKMLKKSKEGYFLLIEGGRIDHGHHANIAQLALHDFVAFDNAVEKVVEMTSDDDTLVIVTADHSHTYNFGGYADRGNPIFGLVRFQGQIAKGNDSKPYTALLYGNGPGGLRPKEALTETMTNRTVYRQETIVPLKMGSHGGEDVAIFARGPMAHLFQGVHEESYIAYAMRYASCVGPDKRHCAKRKRTDQADAQPIVDINPKFMRAQDDFQDMDP